MRRISEYFYLDSVVHLALFRTLKSNITCREEEPTACLPTKQIENPFNVCEADSDCATYNVSAKGFFSSYTQKIEAGVLDGARSLIFEVRLD